MLLCSAAVIFSLLYSSYGEEAECDKEKQRWAPLGRELSAFNHRLKESYPDVTYNCFVDEVAKNFTKTEDEDADIYLLPEGSGMVDVSYTIDDQDPSDLEVLKDIINKWSANLTDIFTRFEGIVLFACSVVVDPDYDDIPNVLVCILAPGEQSENKPSQRNAAEGSGRGSAAQEREAPAPVEKAAVKQSEPPKAELEKTLQQQQNQRSGSSSEKEEKAANWSDLFIF
ncbi:unnamed protein product [Cylicocyclus nassatus]|uniref:Uncharacterized protein n=1 Tax=Cylicocyclus nassatus TaxID=53992 RepID=A0AA36GH22_CYLNA|nr:unnamed protein product [Cylicocyclus nassatus]